MEAKLKRAISMDDMLRRCNSEQDIVYIYPEMSKGESDYLNQTAQLLGGMLLVKRVIHQTIAVSLTDKGKIFVESGRSFVKDIEDEKELARLAKIKLEQEATAHQVNKKALAAAKREPWLIAWTVISTLTALYLTYLQYIKS